MIYVKCIFTIITGLVVFVWAIVHMQYFILGFFPFLSAKNISEMDVENIKKYGIIHKTTSKGKIGIEIEQKIKGSKGTKAYSTHFRKGAYFFASAYLDAGESFNNNFKYEYKIIIENLTDKQIHNFLIRDYDKALIYQNDFVIDNQNIVKYEPILCPKLSITEKLLLYLKHLQDIVVDKYVIAVLISTVLSFGIIAPIFVYLCSILFGII